MNNKKGVLFVRKEIAEKKKEWNVIRDCLIGEIAIKNKGFTYLPYPTTSSKNCENKENDPRYVAYKERANFMNITRRTVYELLSQVFIKEPIVDVSDDKMLDLLINNASGNGVSLVQCAKASLKYALAYAYGGILVDFPNVERLSISDYNCGKYRPTITPLSPFSIRNFRVIDFGVEEKLVLVVLSESFWEYDTDGFEIKENNQLRVLKLNDNGYYEQEIWRSSHYDDEGKGTGEWNIYTKIMPTNADGEYLTEIPFYFIGMENNNPYPDNPIMYDLATLNISHYRNSADYEEGLFITGQPTLFVSGGLGQKEGNLQRLKDTIKLGSHNAIIMDNGGTCGLIQAKENSGLVESMERKEKAMAKFGAKFLETDNVAKTAYQVKVENPSQGSILANCANNVSNAYTKALRLIHDLCGIKHNDIKFELNTDFEYNRIGSDEQNQLINAWTSGAISFEEMRNGLRRAGIATQDDKQVLIEYEKRNKLNFELNQNNSNNVNN